MKRDIRKLKDEIFDVLIVGAGIHGATAAWALSSVGYKTALIDCNDFGSLTSANSLKIIHGGLRYLQQADFKRIRESIISRKIMQRAAAYCVRNVPCVIPTKGYGFRSRYALFFAMKLYDLISFDRNRELAESQKIPKGFTIPKEEVLGIVPHLLDENINGGAVWYETIAENSERLTLEFVHLAHNTGCVVGNYVRALKIEEVQNNVKIIEVQDALTDEGFQIKSKIVIDSTGPYINTLLNETSNIKQKIVPLCKAVNIIVNKTLFNNYAVGLESTREFKDQDALVKSGKRLFFFVPWKNQTIIGTTYTIHNEDPAKLQVDKKDLEEIIDEINATYPSASLKFDDIVYYHSGLLPREPNQLLDSYDIQPAKKSRIIDESTRTGIKGIYSVLSVKYTTAPFIALQMVNLLKRKHPEIPTYPTKKLFEAMEYSSEKETTLYKKYGKHSNKIEKYSENDPSLTIEVLTGSGITEAEIKYFIEEEFAVRLEDVVLRRTDIGSYKFCGHDLLSNVAQKMAKYLHWDKNRINEEILNVVNKYAPLEVEKIQV